ncbi:MAG TPA: DUF305 domain-containing protein [Gemmatimonas sp.]|nr:DUF305 domain-containing protein [Gemmatimonas sp.]
MLLRAILITIALAACAASKVPRAGELPRGGSRTPAEQARADSGRPAYTRADVAFMQGMIGHHAQALVMAGLAPSNQAGESVRVLAERIDVSQRDEIAFMQRWLRERAETVPPVADAHAAHAMPAGGTTDHSAHMPGMLTEQQLEQLAAARGSEFDRLFLTFMIQHHEGAIVMVRQLFASPGAGQEVNVFLFASEVEADQTTEIDRMRRMLSNKAP